MKTLYLYLAYFLLSIQIGIAQAEKLKLFIDCSNTPCDFNYIRQQIPVTDFVRDRRESDIHILITSQRAGNGGEKYDIVFFPQNAVINKNDSMFFFTVPNSPEDEKRKQLVKVIQAGIIPYLAKRGEIDRMNFTFEEKPSNEFNNKKDKWNNWVFSIGGRARFTGDKNYKEKNLSVNSSAGRVTESSKLIFSFFNSALNNTYTIDDNGSKSYLKTTNNYLEAEQEYVKSISPKWSWAVETGFRKSTYNNLKSSLAAAAAIEYNIYPYTLSSSKFFAIRYMLEAVNRKYIEETIYGKLKETLISSNIEANVYFTQPWGNVSSGITFYNYLHDFKKNNLSINANLQLNLLKGLSINLYGNASLIKDQLSLSSEGATSQEVLLKLKALATTFNYFTTIGFNYRFGSKFNNFVNPRFTNGRY